MTWGRIAIAEETLDRIVVLLLALADLAVDVAGARHAQRCLALAIIQSGAIYAADAFDPTFDPADDDAEPYGPDAYPCSTPADALSLAVSLRVLALLLHTSFRKQCLSAEATTDADPRGCSPLPRRRDSLGRVIAVPEPAYADTS